MGSKRSKSLGWVAYDAAYRRKAACSKSLFWGTVDQYLYTVWFTNQANGPACISCFSTYHTTEQCPINTANTAIPVLGQGMAQPAPAQMGNHQQTMYQLSMGQEPVERCGLYNAAGGSRCPYNQCRFQHACKICRVVGHPVPAGK